MVRGENCGLRVLGFVVWDLGFGVEGLGFGVWGLGFGVWCLGFGVRGFGIWSLGSGVMHLRGELLHRPTAVDETRHVLYWGHNSYEQGQPHREV